MLSMWFTILSLFVCCVFASGLDLLNGVAVLSTDTDCSNSTHRWTSQNGNCHDEASGPIPFIPPPSEKPNAFGRYIGGIGITPRDGSCANDETACWIVNCCQPGETCGAITVGCVASWSTIYTTTTTSSWSTIVDTVTPDSKVSYTTATVSTTDYLTSYHPVTLPGAGLDTVVVTVTTTSTSLILSAYTPPAVTVTESAPSVTKAPDVKRAALLPRADLPRRSDRTSYTTITVYVTNYYTAYSTSTLANNLATTTKVIGISFTATRNQTHYATPTDFTTITQTVTSVVSSYAFGSLQPVTKTLTQSLSSSIVAGVSATDDSPSSSQTNPAGAYPVGSHGLSRGAIAGLVVGLLLALLLLALGIFFCCCIRRRRKNRRAESEIYVEKSARSRRRLQDAPSPPSPPSPQPGTSSATPSPPYLSHSNSNSPVSPTSPVMVGALAAPARVYHSNNGNGNGSRLINGRKSSRSSIVSITPVPEEDEGEDDYEAPRVRDRRNSTDSTRSWGRGYGGRGGYGSRTNLTSPPTTQPESRTRTGNHHNGTASPTHPAFGGAIQSTYSDESLVPPHAR